MKTDAPKQVTWIIAVILGILGILGHYGYLPAAAAYDFLLLIGGWALLALGSVVEGL